MGGKMPRLFAQFRCVSAAAGGAVALLGWLTLAAGTLRAEPYMAVRDGYKCSACHVNKTGGGARTDYATIYMQTRLAAGPGFGTESGGARTTDAGQGRAGSSLAFGADVRLAAISTNMDHAATTTTFGRPTDCESCHASTANGTGEAGGGKVAEAFMRFQPVPDVATIVYSASLVPTAATRDFYGMIEQLPLEGYVKAGTFKLPNGLQNTWDYPFQHASQGGYQGLVGFETVYATGLEVGFEPGPFSFALSVTNPDDLKKNATEKRYFLTASAVGRVGLIGINYAQDPQSTTLIRTLTSGFLGTSFGRFTVLGQMDQIDDKDSAASTTTSQQAGLAEVDYLVKRGHNVKYVYEVRDPSTAHTGDVRDRHSLIYEPFFTPYLQGRVGYRKYTGPIVKTNGVITTDNNGEQWFLEGHFVF